MREYKFRGKCVERDKWVYGYYVKGIQEDEAYILKNHNWLLGDDFIDVYPETVGQYTGLFDKNGNELWESDIIENEHKERYLIVWDGTGFKAALNGSKKAIYSANEYWFKSCKKIGNKWDNPELLKEEGV